MNEEVVALLFDVVARLERNIVAHEAPAIIAIEGQRRLFLSDYDYLRDEETAEAFERRVADHARQIDAIRWVAAVPQVWVISKSYVAMRAISHHPLRPGEQECITWTAFDEADGIDYGRVPYTRRPNGEPVFDEPQVFNVELMSSEKMLGRTLLRLLIDDNQQDLDQ